MAVDELQESPASRPAERLAGKQNDTGASDETGRGRRNNTLAFASVLGILVLVGVIGFWLYSRTYESTDDAQVDGHVNGITSRIDGVIKAIYVEENQSRHLPRNIFCPGAAAFSHLGRGAGSWRYRGGRRQAPATPCGV
jgi:hypothetical protein